MSDTDPFKRPDQNIHALFRVDSSDIKNRFFTLIRTASGRHHKNARVEWIWNASHALGDPWRLLADCFLDGLRSGNYPCHPIIKSILPFGESIGTNHDQSAIGSKPAGKNRKPKIVSDQNICSGKSRKDRHCIKEILNEI